MFLPEPLPSAAATSNDLGDVGRKLTHDGDTGESQEPVTEQGTGGDGATAKRRKEELTTEFVARLEIDRANVESVIRARDKRIRLI